MRTLPSASESSAPEPKRSKPTTYRRQGNDPALRLGAHSLARAKGYFGEFFRRMRWKLGTAQAITATAHKIARVLYHVLLTREPYSEAIFYRCEEQVREQAQMRLRKHASQLGFQLIPIVASAKLGS